MHASAFVVGGMIGETDAKIAVALRPLVQRGSRRCAL